MATWWDANGLGHLPNYVGEGTGDMGGRGGTPGQGSALPNYMGTGTGDMSGRGGMPGQGGGFTPLSALGGGFGAAAGGFAGVFGGGRPTGPQPMNVYGATGYVGPGTAGGSGTAVPNYIGTGTGPAGGQGGGAMVTLRAPNGQTQQVPAEHAEYYVARGATRV